MINHEVVNDDGSPPTGYVAETVDKFSAPILRTLEEWIEAYGDPEPLVQNTQVSIAPVVDVTIFPPVNPAE